MLVDRQSGRTWLALEGLNQVWRLDPTLTHVESRRALPEPAWPSNSGPEAMARLDAVSYTHLDVYKSKSPSTERR